MLFGEDNFTKLKKELKSAGADVSFLKQWKKMLDKVKKGTSQIEARYTQVKAELEQVYKVLKEMEAALIFLNDDLTNPSYKMILDESIKELKKHQGHFNQEFLISKEDQEFHLTYQTVLDLSKKGLKGKKDVLILQSEVENIIAVTEEALNKQWPSYQAMAYFYLKRTDKEISDLPHADKVEIVNHYYQKEFLSDIRQVLTQCFGEKKANYILEVEIWM